MGHIKRRLEMKKDRKRNGSSRYVHSRDIRNEVQKTKMFIESVKQFNVIH
jgi:hypothetical protein